MITKLSKWGNGQGLRIPKQLLLAARLNIGDEVDVEVRDGVIIVKPAQKRHYDIHELVSQMPADYSPREDWDEPMSKEAW